MTKQTFSRSVNSDLPIRYSNKALFRQLSNKHILLCCFLYIYLFYIQGEIDNLPERRDRNKQENYFNLVFVFAFGLQIPAGKLLRNNINTLVI